MDAANCEHFICGGTRTVTVKLTSQQMRPCLVDPGARLAHEGTLMKVRLRYINPIADRVVGRS